MTSLPNWRAIPKQAMTDAMRNTSDIAYPTALTRQDKSDLIALIETAWAKWDDPSRASFLRKLQAEIDFRRERKPH
jgi:hypothetical protein